MKRLYWTDLGLLLAVMVLIALLITVRHGNDLAANSVTATSERAQLQYTYGPAYDPVPISEQEQDNGMVVKLERSAPFAQIAIRIDPLTQLTSGLLRRSVADQLRDHTADLYTQYPAFKKVTEVQTTLLGQPTNELTFTYLGNDHATRMQVTVYALERKDTPYFVEFQAPEADVSQLGREFQAFRRSLSFVD